MKIVAVLLLLSLTLCSCSSVNRKDMQNNKCIEKEESWGSYTECEGNRKTNSALKYAGVGLIYGIPIAVGLYSGFWIGWGTLGLSVLTASYIWDENINSIGDYLGSALMAGVIFGGPMVAWLMVGTTDAALTALGIPFGLAFTFGLIIIPMIYCNGRVC
jgi:hypothetical protein